MIDVIINKLLNKKNLILVWETNIWKSHFVLNILIPELERLWINFSYFLDCNELFTDKSDLYLIDEVELLFDKEFLERINPNEVPYYDKSYLNKVNKWQGKLSWIENTLLCIVTRNQKSAIRNLVENYKSFEWNNAEVEVVEFKW